MEYLKQRKVITSERVTEMQKAAQDAVDKVIFKSVEEMLGGKSIEEEIAQNWIRKHKGNFTDKQPTEKEKNLAKKMLKSGYHDVKKLDMDGGFGRFLKFLYSGFKNMTTAIERDAYWTEIKTGFLFKTMPKNALNV